MNRIVLSFIRLKGLHLMSCKLNDLMYKGNQKSCVRCHQDVCRLSLNEVGGCIAVLLPPYCGEGAHM